MVINWLAVLVAALAGFAMGGLWYGPLFGKAWRQLVGLHESDIARVNMSRVYGTVFVLQLIMAVNLAMFLGPESTLLTGGLYGFAAGFGWVALAFAVNAMFEQRSLSYMLINGAYWSVAFTLMGLILGAWH